jgi:hypothetical protein
MLLTKIKGAALVLLLAASVGVGTVTLTYRAMAAEQQQTKADAPRTAVQAAFIMPPLRTGWIEVDQMD